ncbi:MAG TPA: beta-xylosidase [Verrucomicrobiae bacterium]|nr:beta-xylosidase [Verrucomicrobiae bacterium]
MPLLLRIRSAIVGQNKILKTRPLTLLLVAFVFILHPAARADDSNLIPVVIHVDAAKPLGELHPFWRFFGADEPNYATMSNGTKLIGELGALSSNHIYFRTHNLLTSGDGTAALKWGSTGAYSEDANGNPIYNWTILDHIFDTYLQRGVRPYAQIGFMPKELSVHPEPYQHHWKPGDPYGDIFTGWAYPPRDYAKWENLVYEWVKHCVEKYGRAEVESWYWEVWNESNIGYWKGTPQEFLKLHDYAVDGVKRALPTARVGGADTAGSGGGFSRNFLEHCLRGTNFATGKIGTPIDFFSFHAKGAPSFPDGHVRMGIANQLRTVEDGFRILAAFPELKSKPVIIGESDPDGCAACAEAEYPQNGYRNGTLYASYTAEVFARKGEIAARDGINLEGAITWAFEFENTPLFAGYRDLATGGLDKPVLNVFRMFSLMSGQRLDTQSDHAVPLNEIISSGVRAQPDISALASLDQNQLCIMVWYYHDDDLPGPDAAVDLTLDHLPISNGNATLRHYRIDENHSNAFAAWRHLGSPQQPTAEQYAELEKAGQLATLAEPANVTVSGSKITLHFTLPRQAISLLKLSW